MHTPKGLGVDIRPIRMDGAQGDAGRVTWKDRNYDRDATQQLVNTLLETGQVNKIFFNDPNLKGVTRLDGHDNHMHVEIKPWKK
jgi:hypothetical protein